MKTASVLAFALTIISTARAAPEMPEISARMRTFVDAKEIAGAVTLVEDGETILHFAATGLADLESKRPMTPDALFWIASMTKPITATAVMMMQEEGLLSVDDPVSKYLPEFANLKDAEGREASVTISQCLTHTAGLSEVSQEEIKGVTTLAALMPLVVAKPVKFPAGTKWEYSQTGINTAGRIVEIVSGKSFPEFLSARLLGPLGMKDTTFYPNESRAARIASSYSRNAAGELEKSALRYLGGRIPSAADLYPMANGGLFSTAADYARFARMILRGGELDGVRYLKPESVSLMTGVRSGDLKTGFTPGNGWGLGWCVVREPQGVTAMLSAGTFGHGGAYGTQAWIDPVEKRAYIMLIQRSDLANGDASSVRQGFQEAATARP